MAEKAINTPQNDHEKALELKDSLRAQLDQVGFERVMGIINDVVLGPYKTERSDAEQAGGSRSKVRQAINHKSDEQAVQEVLAKMQELGITKSEAKRFTEVLTEYVILLNKLNSIRA